MKSAVFREPKQQFSLLLEQKAGRLLHFGTRRPHNTFPSTLAFSSSRKGRAHLDCGLKMAAVIEGVLVFDVSLYSGCYHCCFDTFHPMNSKTCSPTLFFSFLSFFYFILNRSGAVISLLAAHLFSIFALAHKWVGSGTLLCNFFFFSMSISIFEWICQKYKIRVLNRLTNSLGGPK